PGSLASRAGRDCRLTKPVVEPDVAELRFVAREERAFVESGAEVARVSVDDHFAWVVARSKDALEESVEVERFGPADLNGAIQRRACRHPGAWACHIVGRNWLGVYRRHSNGRAVSRGVSDVHQELEELRRLDDRIRDRRGFDQLLLRKLGAKVAAS